MGLDMYLTYEYNTTEPIAREVMYWRKANAIHRWFVMNVQDGKDDCDQYPVSQEDLKNLVRICSKVLEKSNDEDRQAFAQYFLPTTSGFFFGPTEYDEWYFHHLQRTVTELTDFMNDIDNWDDVSVAYQSSW